MKPVEKALAELMNQKPEQVREWTIKSIQDACAELQTCKLQWVVRLWKQIAEDLKQL